MGSMLKRFFSSLVSIDPEERSKVLYLAISFFLIIGVYTLSKELKDAVFVNVVGVDYQPLAKLLSMFILIPAIFLYARLVDVLKRHQLLYVYAGVYGIVGLLFSYYLTHPIIGLVNTDSSPYRIFGWLFYFFMEGFSPFVVGVFWAFVNSISSPDSVKNNYPIIIIGSKLGGIAMSLGAWLFLSTSIMTGSAIEFDAYNHQMILAFCSLCLLVIPLIIYRLIVVVPKYNMHGYEASYQEAKQYKKEHKGEKKPLFSSMLSGLRLLLKHPYVFGIFAVGFFYELINQVFNFDRLVFGKQTANTITGMSTFLITQALLVHIIGLVVVLFGTRTVLRYLGEKWSLILVPTVAGCAILFYLLAPSGFSATLAFVVIRSVNYAFATPLRESLYIPTIKEVQFKSKSWIDGFGSKFAKTTAAGFNYSFKALEGVALISAKSSFFAVAIGLWVVIAYLLGKRFEDVVENDEVIGRSKRPA
jgi:AAA family ATP:ADP antiporter